jgi:hypothetical protein
MNNVSIELKNIGKRYQVKNWVVIINLNQLCCGLDFELYLQSFNYYLASIANEDHPNIPYNSYYALILL